MGVFSTNPKRNEQEPGGSGPVLHVELDEVACPVCRRPLMPWQRVCPDDGAAAVPRAELPPPLPPPPAHLLDDED